jgi:hypothetical protein
MPRNSETATPSSTDQTPATAPVGGGGKRGVRGDKRGGGYPSPRRPGWRLTKREQYRRDVQANLDDPNRDEDRHCLTPGNPILARIVAATGSQGDPATARPPDGRDLDRLDPCARATLEQYLAKLLAGEHEIDAVAACPGLTYARLLGCVSTYPTFAALRRECQRARDQFHADRRLSVADTRARAGSDRLLICLLGGDDPHRYGRQVVNQHTGAVEVRDGLSRLLDEIAGRGRFDPSGSPHPQPTRNPRVIDVAQDVDAQPDIE